MLHSQTSELVPGGSLVAVCIRQGIGANDGQGLALPSHFKTGPCLQSVGSFAPKMIGQVGGHPAGWLMEACHRIGIERTCSR